MWATIFFFFFFSGLRHSFSWSHFESWLILSWAGWTNLRRQSSHQCLFFSYTRSELKILLMENQVHCHLNQQALVKKLVWEHFCYFHFLFSLTRIKMFHYFHFVHVVRNLFKEKTKSLNKGLLGFTKMISSFQRFVQQYPVFTTPYMNLQQSENKFTILQNVYLNQRSPTIEFNFHTPWVYMFLLG